MTSPRHVHLESLLGRMVVDRAGKRAGRIEEFVAHVDADGVCTIAEYLLGGAALLDRLSVPALALAVLRPLGARGSRPSHRVAWHELDLSDPVHPRLMCAREDLRPWPPGPPA